MKYIILQYLGVFSIPDLREWNISINTFLQQKLCPPPVRLFTEGPKNLYTLVVSHVLLSSDILKVEPTCNVQCVVWYSLESLCYSIGCQSHHTDWEDSRIYFVRWSSYTYFLAPLYIEWRVTRQVNRSIWFNCLFTCNHVSYFYGDTP
jgi:hypothetical protein